MKLNKLTISLKPIPKRSIHNLTKCKPRKMCCQFFSFLGPQNDLQNFFFLISEAIVAITGWRENVRAMIRDRRGYENSEIMGEKIDFVIPSFPGCLKIRSFHP